MSKQPINDAFEEAKQANGANIETNNDYNFLLDYPESLTKASNNGEETDFQRVSFISPTGSPTEMPAPSVEPSRIFPHSFKPSAAQSGGSTSRVPTLNQNTKVPFSTSFQPSARQSETASWPPSYNPTSLQNSPQPTSLGGGGEWSKAGWWTSERIGATAGGGVVTFLLSAVIYKFGRNLINAVRARFRPENYSPVNSPEAESGETNVILDEFDNPIPASRILKRRSGVESKHSDEHVKNPIRSEGIIRCDSSDISVETKHEDIEMSIRPDSDRRKDLPGVGGGRITTFYKDGVMVGGEEVSASGIRLFKVSYYPDGKISEKWLYDRAGHLLQEFAFNEDGESKYKIKHLSGGIRIVERNTVDGDVVTTSIGANGRMINSFVSRSDVTVVEERPNLDGTHTEITKDVENNKTSQTILCQDGGMSEMKSENSNNTSSPCTIVRSGKNTSGVRLLAEQKDNENAL